MRFVMYDGALKLFFESTCILDNRSWDETIASGHIIKIHPA